MSIRFERIEKAQALMREQGWVGIMIMNHNNYHYTTDSTAQIPVGWASGYTSGVKNEQLAIASH
jgi:hypothetical protein